MGRFLVVLFATISEWFRRNRAWVILCFASLLCACSVAGGVATLPPSRIPQERVRAVCWTPSDVDIDKDAADEYFVMGRETDPPISSKQRPAFDWAVADGALIYKFSDDAPIENLRLLPLRYSDAWCTRIPKPTDKAVLQLLDPCATASLMQDERSVGKNLFAQTDGPTYRSALFCGQPARMALTTQEIILLRSRNEAFQQSYDYAHKTAMTLTQAEADMQAVINKDHSWLKRAFTSDPGTLEQIQQRVTDALDFIEAPPEYGDTILDGIALAGMNAGFENGKFEVEAKLFAIEAGIVIIEVVAMEVALGPMGGAKFLASAVSKGTKALGAAASRLENIPIFLPLANGGAGAVITIGKVINAARRGSSTKLANALIAANIKRPAGTDAHHIVALGHKLAIRSREILAKFGVKLDEAVNGVFLPSNLKSPNPNGAIVHATLGNKRLYYEKVEAFLEQAKSKNDLIKRLAKIRETLENGTFYDAI